MANSVYKTYEVTVDTMQDIGSSKTIRYSQNDLNSAKLLINIKHGGNELDLSSATSVSISFRKQDRKLVYQDCQAINALSGKYQVVLNTQTLVVTGKVEFQVHIELPSQKIDTQKFFFIVDESLMSDEIIESTNELPFLQKAIDAGEQLEGVDIPALIASKDTAEAAQTKAETAQAKADDNANKIGILSELDWLPANVVKAVNDLRTWLDQRTINVRQPPYNAKGDGTTDDTVAVQKAATALKNGDILFFPFGTYLIGQINFKAMQRVQITGKGTIQAKAGDYEAVFNIPTNTYYLDVRGLTFKGLKGVTGAPTSYSPDKNLLLKTADSCGYITIEGNTFTDHMGHFMSLGSVPGSDVEYSYTVQNNIFRDMVDLNDNRQCALLLRNNFQYSNILYNKFYNCMSSIHCYSANNRINYNTISGGTLNVVGTPTKIDDYFNLGQAHIVCMYSGDPTLTNSAKMQIIGNKMNHLNGNAPTLMCAASLQRNECYFDIAHNEMLVNKGDFNILLKENKSTRLISNSMGNTVAGSQKYHIGMARCTDIQVDKNLFIGDYKTIKLEGVTWYDGQNIFQGMGATTDNYEYVVDATATVSNRRFSDLINFTFLAVSGSFTGYTAQLTMKDWTITKNSVGNYTITHNLGHTGYIAMASAFGEVACVKNFTANTFDVLCYDQISGAAKDAAVSGNLVLVKNRHDGWHNVTKVPNRIV